MIYPSLSDLLKKIDNKYALVIIAAQRAIQLSKGEQKLLDSNDDDKLILTSLEEITEGKVKYKLK